MGWIKLVSLIGAFFLIVFMSFFISAEHTLQIVSPDVTSPNVTLVSPANSSEDSDGDLDFVYTVSDGGISISNCSLIFSSLVNQTNTSITKDANQSFNLTDLGIGTYNWSVNCTDSSMNVGSSEERIFNVVSPTTTETTIATGGGVSSYTPTVTQLGEGYTRSLGTGAKIDFEVSGESHRLKVNKIENNSVTITISSNPITITLVVGESRKLDLDGDGVYDLFVKLNSLTSLRADITIKEIDELIEVEDEIDAEVQNGIGGEVTDWTPRIYFIGGILTAWVLFISSIIFLLIGIRKKKLHPKTVVKKHKRKKT
jgi:hypothetical protein